MIIAHDFRLDTYHAYKDKKALKRSGIKAELDIYDVVEEGEGLYRYTDFFNAGYGDYIPIHLRWKVSPEGVEYLGATHGERVHF